MRLLYKPFGIIAGIVSARLGRSVFRSVWSKLDDAPPPAVGSGEAGVAKTVGATALEAGVMAGVAAGVDALFARAFHHLIGIWPRKPAKPEPGPKSG
jgi:Protein of unknown function (DUF4235)